MKLADCKKWHYQLDGFLRVPDGVDLLVQDADDTSRPAVPYRAAYLSIGEAEDYRGYWQKLPRDLLLGENPEWPGNHAVAFWDYRWQQIMLRKAQQIAADGFDAIYIDKADVIWDLEGKVEFDERLLTAAMAVLIGYIKSASKLDIILQNATALANHGIISGQISGYAREDLFYGETTTGEPNSSASVDLSLFTYHVKRKPVFVIEYIDDPVKAAGVAARCPYPLIVEREDRALNGRPWKNFEGHTP